MAKKPVANDGFQELKAAIRNKNLGRLYFFHGEETYLMNNYLNSVKKFLLDPLTESFNFHRFTSENFDLASFMEAVENLPMMAENTMIQVDDIDPFKFNEDERTKIISVFKDIPDYCTVVFTYLTVSWSPDKRYRKLWDAVNENGLAVNFAKMEVRDLVPWISRHFAEQNKKISNKLCEYLIDRTGGAMTALHTEIEKICAYSGADEICQNDIDEVVEPVLDAVVFDMTKQISDGSYVPALHNLQKLLKMQQEPLQILGAIGSHFRRILAVKILAERGKSYYELQNIFGIKEYPAKKSAEAAETVDLRFCGRAMELIMETDYKMKTSFDDSERLLELLILQMASEARNG